MTILGGSGIHAIPEPARPDALAACRSIIKQPKPLRAAATPRADKHRPEAAVSERSHSDADAVFDAVIAEPDERRHSIALDVTVRHQGRHANQRQIFNSARHGVETYCSSDQHSILLCMMARTRASFDRRAAVDLKPASVLLLAWRPASFGSAAGRPRVLPVLAVGGSGAFNFSCGWRAEASERCPAEGAERASLGTCQNPHGGFGGFVRRRSQTSQVGG